MYVTLHYDDMLLQDMAINEPRNGVKGSFNRFKDLVLRHSVERPPWSMGVFAIEVCVY